MLMVINHLTYLCIELQFFFMVLTLSGFLNNYSLETGNLIITKLSKSYYKCLDLKIDFFKDLNVADLISDFGLAEGK